MMMSPFLMLWFFAEPTSIPLLQTPAGFGAPTYLEVRREAMYLTMRDGVKIAIDLYLPVMPAGSKIPALVEQTRYWRAPADLKGPAPEAAFFTQQGYAVLLVDVRGSGASFGHRPQLYSEDEIGDGREIVAWIVDQPWSNGRVGTFGVSYTANTAALALSYGHPAVRITIPRFFDYDLYTDLAYPGGVKNTLMLREWGKAVQALDRNQLGRGVAPVDGPQGSALLKQAVAQRTRNIDVNAATQKVHYKDDFLGADKVRFVDMSLYPRQNDFQNNTAFQFLWGSWLDAGTAQGALHQLMADSRKRTRIVIGAWSHGGGHHASPFLGNAQPSSPSPPDQRIVMLRAFDAHLKEDPKSLENFPRLTYYTMGEERWHTAAQWPVPGIGERQFFFSDSGLSPNRPVTAGVQNYTVDFSASTGKRNRWFTQLGGSDVVYPDRAKADRKLLTYDSPPLAQAMEITGWPVVHLQLSSTHQDGVVYVYLEDVAPDGRVTYVTEGQLRLIHRNVSQADPPYPMSIPYHTFEKEDAAPMIPGAVAKISFGLLPTSVVIRRGHRLRIAIAGADKHTFKRLPEKGKPVLSLHHGGANPAFLSLPCKARPDLDHPLPTDPRVFVGSYAVGQDEVLVTGEDGLLTIRAKGLQALRLLEPGAFSAELAEPIIARFETLLTALRNRDKATAKKIALPRIFAQLGRVAKELQNAGAHHVTGVWLQRGLIRVAFSVPIGGKTYHPQFLFTPDLKLFHLYDHRPLPGGVRLVANGADRYRALENEGFSVRFETAAGGISAIIINGKRLLRNKP